MGWDWVFKGVIPRLLAFVAWTGQAGAVFRALVGVPILVWYRATSRRAHAIPC